MKKIKSRTLANIIILLVVGFSCFTLGLLAKDKFNQELFNTYNCYYSKTEALLDSIYSSGVMSEDSFTDIVMETDAYYEYEVSRDKVDSLISPH